jgi:hypothetical protein
MRAGKRGPLGGVKPCAAVHVYFTGQVRSASLGLIRLEVHGFRADLVFGVYVGTLSDEILCYVMVIVPARVVERSPTSLNKIHRMHNVQMCQTCAIGDAQLYLVPTCDLEPIANQRNHLVYIAGRCCVVQRRLGHRRF